MKKWKCIVCGYIYDEAKGLPQDDIAAETLFQDLHEDWECPDCGATKDEFVVMD